MSSDGRKSATGSVIDQHVISESRPLPDKIESVSPMRPPRLRNLSSLLYRENVGGVICVGDIKFLKLTATFNDKTQTHETIRVEPGGSIAIVILTDDPENVGGEFYDIKLPDVPHA